MKTFVLSVMLMLGSVAPLWALTPTVVVSGTPTGTHTCTVSPTPTPSATPADCPEYNYAALPGTAADLGNGLNDGDVTTGTLALSSAQSVVVDLGGPTSIFKVVTHAYGYGYASSFAYGPSATGPWTSIGFDPMSTTAPDGRRVSMYTFRPSVYARYFRVDLGVYINATFTEIQMIGCDGWPSATPSRTASAQPTFTNTPSGTWTRTTSPTATPAVVHHIGLVKSTFGTPGPVNASPIGYNIAWTFKNIAPLTAGYLEIVDTFPAGFGYASATASSGPVPTYISYSAGVLTVRWDGSPAVSAGDAGNIQVFGYCTTGTLGYVFTNVASASTDGPYGTAYSNPASIQVQTSTPTTTFTRTASPTFSSTVTRTPSRTAVTTASNTPSGTATRTVSPTGTPSATPFPQTPTTTSTEPPAVAFTKALVSGSGLAGTQATYVLDLEVLGANFANDNYFWDTLPAGTSFNSAVPAPAAVVGDLVSWHIVKIPGYSHQSLTLVVDVLSDGPICNQASYSSYWVAPAGLRVSDIVCVGGVTAMPSATASPTRTGTQTATHTPTVSPTATPTLTPTFCFPCLSHTPTLTRTPTFCAPCLSQTLTPTITPAVAGSGTVTPTRTVTCPCLISATTTPTGCGACSATSTSTVSQTLTQTLTVTRSPTTGPGTVDLQVTGLGISMYPVPACLSGSAALGLLVDFVNAGTSAAGPFYVRVGATDLYVAGLGASATGSIWFSGVSIAGSYTADIDATGLVAESDEANNSTTAFAPVPTPPPACTTMPTATPTASPSSTGGPTGTFTRTATGGPTSTVTRTATGGMTGTATRTATGGLTASATRTATPGASATRTPTKTFGVTPIVPGCVGPAVPACTPSLVYAPVCGCNGTTYNNSSAALCAGIGAWTNGPCGTTPIPYPGLGRTWPYPVPAIGFVYLGVELRIDAHIRVEVLNSKLRLVSVLTGDMPAGSGRMMLDLSGFAAGYYYYKMTLTYTDGQVVKLPIKSFLVKR